MKLPPACSIWPIFRSLFFFATCAARLMTLGGGDRAFSAATAGEGGLDFENFRFPFGLASGLYGPRFGQAPKLLAAEPPLLLPAVSAAA